MSIPERYSSGLDEIPNLLDRVGGGGTTTTPSCTRNNNCATIAMLTVQARRTQESTSHVVEKLEKKITDLTTLTENLRRQLDQEKEKRVEDANALTKCIKSLMGEVQNLKSWVALLETKLEDNLATRVNPSTMAGGEDRQIPSTSATGAERPQNLAVDPEILRLMKREIGADAEANGRGNPTSEGSQVRTRKRKKVGRRNNSRKKARETSTATAAAPSMNEASSSGNGTQPMDAGADTDPEIVHGKSSSAGQYLNNVCLCGLEYDTLNALSVHVVEQRNIFGKNPSNPPPQATATNPATVELSTAGPSSAFSMQQPRGNLNGFVDSSSATIRTSTPSRASGGSVPGNGHVQAPQENAMGDGGVTVNQREKTGRNRRARPKSQCPRKRTGPMASIKPSTSTGGTRAGKQIENGNGVDQPPPPTPPMTPIRSKRISEKKAKKTPRHEADPSKPFHCTCGVQCRDEAALISHISCKIMTVSLQKIETPSPTTTPAPKRRPSQQKSQPLLPTTTTTNQLPQEPQMENGDDKTYPPPIPPPSPFPQFHCKCGKKYGSKNALNSHIRKLVAMNAEPGTHFLVEM